MDILEKVSSTVEEHDLFDHDSGLLCMVSGGSDSTALARILAQMRDEGHIDVLTMLHFNHKLRGDDSEADAAFVARLADELDIPLFMCEMDIAEEAARIKGNIEAVAREERYSAAREALLSMCEHESVPVANAKIVTAHTLDDRIENFYMRSIVGTGPGGFRAMLYQNKEVVRPLLDCTRAELQAYLEGQTHIEDTELWREDATNALTDRFRNYVRHKLVPVAREWNPSLDTTLLRSMNLVADEDDMLEGMASELIEASTTMLGEHDQDGFFLDPAFGNARTPIGRRAIRRLLKRMLGEGTRIDASSIECVLSMFENGAPISGAVENIQGNIAISSNKRGVRIEPMSAFRSRRKRDNK